MFDFMIYNVTREEVEKLNLEGVKKFIFSLNKMKKQAYQSAIIMIDGYDDTKDELYEIKAVRRFVGKMVEKFPHLLYFLNQKMEAHVYILASLGDVDSFHQGEKVTKWDSLMTGVPETEMRLKINLGEKWHKKMTEGVKSFHRITKDEEGTCEILSTLDYFYNP